MREENTVKFLTYHLLFLLGAANEIPLSDCHHR